MSDPKTPKSAAAPENKKSEKPKDSGATVNLSSPEQWGETLAKIAMQSQTLVQEFFERQQQKLQSSTTTLDAKAQPNQMNLGMGDNYTISQSFMEMANLWMSNPTKIIESNYALWQDYLKLWQDSSQRLMGLEVPAQITPSNDDKRFRDDSWNENLIFDYIKQSYLLTARWLQSNVQNTEGLDEKTQRKVEFYTRQFVDAMAPSNFVFTNPQVLKATVESGGENLLKGLSNMLGDLERGNGKLSISMTDPNAFNIGKNLAITAGKVIFQNELMQLIQYEPSTKTVAKTPLLIIPPWINKYYILDLREQNSLVKWIVDQGYTVFMISWINPDASLAHKSFEDYMIEGPLAAATAITAATGEEEMQVIGYCLGGTLLACTLSYMETKKDKRFKAVTFLTTMLDFAEAGELSVFIDEEQLTSLEERMNREGYLEGNDMAVTFNLLRANDLIWSFVINNYLLGKDPFPFDLLYWNSDSTRMPAAMHSFYLRQMYQANRLCVPNGITLKGVAIDLGKITTPALFVSTREDHIAPWKSTYAGTQLLGSKPKFILASSGHIAGVVNPPIAGKYAHWINDSLPAAADDWFESAKQANGSWWPEWHKYAANYGGEMVPARKPGAGKLPIIEAAPGSFVRVKS